MGGGGVLVRVIKPVRRKTRRTGDSVFLSADIFILVDLTFKVDIKAQNLSTALLLEKENGI